MPIEHLPESEHISDLEDKPSFFIRNGHVIFWGTMILMPALNLTAAIVNAKSASKALEIEELKLAIEKLKQNAQS